MNEKEIIELALQSKIRETYRLDEGQENFQEEVAEILDFVRLIREKDLARITDLEEALQYIKDNVLSIKAIHTYDVANTALANKSDWLAKHDEPLLAKIAMLTETTEYARDVAKNNKLDSVVYSLNVTLSAAEPEVEEWLKEHDAEVRAKVLEEAAEWFEHNKEIEQLQSELAAKDNEIAGYRESLSIAYETEREQLRNQDSEPVAYVACTLIQSKENEMTDKIAAFKAGRAAMHNEVIALSQKELTALYVIVEKAKALLHSRTANTTQVSRRELAETLAVLRAIREL